MSRVEDFIASGILEQYVFGDLTIEESGDVEHMVTTHEAVRVALDAIEDTMETVARAVAVQPHPTVKPFLMATLDFMERIKAGEQPAVPPSLGPESKAEDYRAYLDRPDMVLPDDLDQFHARIIGHTPQEITAIVWIEEHAPKEQHDDEYEKFLILEGSCDIVIEGDEVHSLVAGDFLAIPLHKVHEVKVTSDGPCKLILQRTAA